MLQILKSEFLYNKYSYIAPHCFIGLLFVYQVLSPGEAHFMIFLLTFIMVNQIHISRVREKRDRQHMLLPVSARQNALSRLILSLLFCCSAYVFYIILLVMFSDNPVIHVRALGILFGFNICAFSILFMLRDVYLMSGRSRVLKFIGSYTTLFLLFLVLMLAGVWAFWITEQTGKPPAALVMLIDFIRAYNPFSGPYGVYRFLGFSLLLAGLSVVSFSRRSSFAE